MASPGCTHSFPYINLSYREALPVVQDATIPIKDPTSLKTFHIKQLSMLSQYLQDNISPTCCATCAHESYSSRMPVEHFVFALSSQIEASADTLLLLGSWSPGQAYMHKTRTDSMSPSCPPVCLNLLQHCACALSVQNKARLAHLPACFAAGCTVPWWCCGFPTS